MLGSREEEKRGPRIQLAGFTLRKKDELTRLIGELGGILINAEQLDTQVTHIVCGKPSRSEKFLGGIASGKWILTGNYVIDSHSVGQWLSEDEYEWDLGKIHLVSHVENASSLLASTRRWRTKISNGGTSAFFGWRAAVLVEDPMRKSVYERLLQFGGAAIVSMRVPVRRPMLIARDVSHVFVEPCRADAVQGLLNHGVLCLLPVYIALFLIMDPVPDARDYLVSNVGTPEEVGNSNSIQQKTRSSQKTPRTSPRSSPTPNKTPLAASNKMQQKTQKLTKTRSSPRTSPKPHKIPATTQRITPPLKSCNTLPTTPCTTPPTTPHISPFTTKHTAPPTKPVETREVTRAGSIKRSISQAPTSATTHTMKVARLDEELCRTATLTKLELPWIRACPDVTYRDRQQKSHQAIMQVSTASAEVFDAYLEESRSREALEAIQSSVSSTRYPQPRTMHHIITRLLLPCTSVVLAQRTFVLLRQVLSLHPPASPAMRRLYLAAIQGPEVKSDGNTIPAWDLLNSSFGIALGITKGTTPQQQLNHRLFLNFITAAMESDLALYQRNFRSGQSRENVTMWAQVLWPQGQVGKMNNTCRQLFKRLVEAYKPSATNQEMQMADLLQSLVAMTMWCCNMVTGGKPTAVRVSPQYQLLVSELAFLIHGHTGDAPELLQQLLASLKLPGLRLQLTRALLDLYDDSLLTSLGSTTSEPPPLTLRHIVTHYFYLVPPLSSQIPSSPHCKAETRTSSQTPRQELKSKYRLRTPMVSKQDENVDTRTSSQKTPTKAAAALVRKIAIINKKNLKEEVPPVSPLQSIESDEEDTIGETALHRACIKNNVLRVRELLQTPGIDVNLADNAGWTALHEASNHGSIECMTELLRYRPPKTIDTYFTQGCAQTSRKVNLLAANELGITPLHDAVSNYQVEAVRLLLQYGGPELLKAETTDGRTPFDLAETDAIRDLLNATSGAFGQTTAFLTPRRRRPHMAANDDSQNSVESQASSVESQDQNECGFSRPSEFIYQDVIKVDVASAHHCLIYVILLRHLVGSYMTIHQIAKLKHHLADPAPTCHLSGKDCKPQSSSRRPSLCRHLAATNESTEEDVKEDIGVLLHWRHHQENLRCHLERISSQEPASSVTLQGHLTTLLQCGTIN